MVFVYIIVCLAALNFSKGAQGEFSPQTLECRSRMELLLPMTRIPVFRGPWEYSRFELIDYLIAKGYWTAEKTDSPNWISSFHSNKQWEDGQAIFHQEMRWRSKHWIEWSDTHPEFAAYLWPKILAGLRSPDHVEVYQSSNQLITAKYAANIEEYELMLQYEKERNDPIR